MKLNGKNQYIDTGYTPHVMNGSTRIIDGAVINTTYIDGKLTLKTFGPNPPIVFEKDGLVVTITNT